HLGVQKPPLCSEGIQLLCGGMLTPVSSSKLPLMDSASPLQPSNPFNSPFVPNRSSAFTLAWNVFTQRDK
ncbi:hypothetical protein KUCAC02_019977, partial [Chaenocephalus aceratus]